jgi:hypothetical protein
MFIGYNITRCIAIDWDTLNEAKQNDLARNKKKFLNTIAVEHMTIEKVHDRNSYNDLILWFNSIMRFIN